MKGTLLTLNEFYNKHNQNESKDKFVKRMIAKGVITCNSRSALRHLANDTSYIFTRKGKHIHLTKLRG